MLADFSCQRPAAVCYQQRETLTKIKLDQVWVHVCLCAFVYPCVSMCLHGTVSDKQIYNKLHKHTK